MEQEKKKKWETPKLICLYRGRPEEAVLQLTCKRPGVQGPNETSLNECIRQGTCKSNTGT